MENKVSLFQCTQPCSNCPYRIDAPLRHWHKEEFKKVLDSEKDYIGSTFLCHKKNGSMCIGWLMDQDKRNHPSIALRLLLSKHNVTREYLDNLHSPQPLYKTVKEMIKANFPELLREKFKNKSIACCKCGTRQTITFPVDAITAQWDCQEPTCRTPNHVNFKIINGKTIKTGPAFTKP